MSENKIEAPLSLMDRAHAMTFSSAILNRKLSNDSKHILANYRAKLRQAERFVLDDNAVELICRLSHERDKLADWSFLARLPHPIMWIEFNLHHKVRVWEKMGSRQHPFNPAQVSPVVGYLFYKDDSDTRWICHEFHEFRGEITPGFLAFIFDPEGDPANPIKGSSVWKKPTLSHRKNFPKIPVVINQENSSAPPIQTQTDAEYILCGVFDNIKGIIPSLIGEDPYHINAVINAPGWFTSRGACIADPFTESYYWTNTNISYNEYNLILSREVTEQAGLIRWFVTMFACINALPKNIKYLPSRVGQAFRYVGMNRVPYLRHANLSIEIPRDDRVLYAKKRMDRMATGRRMAWHPVIGHWRVVEPGKAQGRICRHIPTMVEAGLGMCELCELMIRWIEVPNGRGDPSLGIVEHTRQVQGKKRIYPTKSLNTAPSNKHI